MLVLFPVPEIRNSGRETGRRGGSKMEVPTQHSGDEAQQVAGKAGVELARERGACHLRRVIAAAKGGRGGVLVRLGCYDKAPQTGWLINNRA